MAGEMGIAGLAGIGRAGCAKSQCAGKRARELQPHDDPPDRMNEKSQRLPARVKSSPAMIAATAAKAG
jgi:hypothetical protein